MNTRRVSWLGIFVGLCVLVGVAGAVVWSFTVALPAYHVESDYSATMTEAGRRAVFAADARFVLVGLVAGLVIGIVGWTWFKRLGWTVVLVVVLGALAAAGTCLGIGQLMGPGAFAPRLASARPGDNVPVALELHAPSALFVWPMMASIPALIGSLRWLFARRTNPAELDVDDVDDDAEETTRLTVTG